VRRRVVRTEPESLSNYRRDRRSMKDYRRMNVVEKQAHQRAQMREAAVVCPVCEVQTTARDLLGHMATRCPGRREPHPASAWVTWREALALGVPRGTLSRWVARGLVRSSGEIQDRRYLLRDLATCVAWRTLLRRTRPLTEVLSAGATHG
jgi:hypothetical protein